MSAYTEAVEAGLKGLKFPSFGPICGGDCPECEGFTEDAGDEGHFSWRPCSICGTTLGGNRYVWHWVDDDGEIIHEDSGCVDCLIYLSNGDEPEGWRHRVC